MLPAAEQVGYSNQAYFSRLFKQKFQMTPYEFRNMKGKQ
ncbi:helix-turn-helix domain-containing protein [Enterocloster aldenensis]